MKDCKYIVRENLCSNKDKCYDKYSFGNKVKVDGKYIYGVCEKDS